jgi:uncharacterized protein (DUF486 family)
MTCVVYNKPANKKVSEKITFLLAGLLSIVYYTGHDFTLTFLLAGLLCTTQVMIFLSPFC